MDNSERMSGRQATKLFLIAAISPLIILIPNFVASHAGKAGWISAFIALGFCVGFAVIVNNLFNNKKKNIINLENAFEHAFGKAITKGLLVLLLVIQLLLIAVRLRVFTERLETLLFVDTVPSLFMIVLLSAVFVASKLKLKFLGRFSELMEIVLFIVFAIIISICLQNFDITNLYPVITYDIPDILFSTVAFLALFASYSYIFILGESITDRHQILKSGITSAVIICAIGLGVICITIGAFGPNVVTAFSQPFFMALKSADILGVFEGIDSMFVSFWILTDYAMIIYHTVISGAILQKLFKLQSRSTMVAPIIFISYILALALAKNFFVITEFTNNIVIYLNIFLGMVLPVIAFIVLKIKKKA
ncbi:MAG: GerAB/ArcD/ProY family transporter [Clostridia bacterium]|nr:GerAB/ArcD/ProY family transporter [Clostridia bacterium]